MEARFAADAAVPNVVLMADAAIAYRLRGGAEPLFPRVSLGVPRG